ncbi:MAG: hypothetical protein K0M60_00920, partial [Hydrogenophaga sp.]|nr:hypothetical protein [Hydrogenophaga sp.]
MAFVLAFCEASFSEGSAAREFGYPIIDRIDANIFRLDATAVPVHDFAVLRMSRLCHCVEEAVRMFRDEWHCQRGDTPIPRIAIADDHPEEPYLYPEFVLARQLFLKAG